MWICDRGSCDALCLIPTERILGDMRGKGLVLPAPLPAQLLYEPGPETARPACALPARSGQLQPLLRLSSLSRGSRFTISVYPRIFLNV